MKIYISDSCLVCRMRVERGDLLGVTGDDLVEFYTGGRAGSTFST